MNGRIPSLRGIETFVCVAEVRSLGVASERLNVTVSAISHRIQALEQELGVTLFDRGKRTLKLSPAGAAYLERLRPGLQVLREATGSARTSAQKSVIRISAPPVFHDQWLLPRLAEFSVLWPQTRIELLSFGRRRALGTDILIAPLTQTTQRDGAVALFDLLVTPVCSPDFARENRPATPRDLLDLPLIDMSPSPDGWKMWFSAAGVEADIPEPALTVDNQVLICQAAAKGLGVALASQHLVEGYLSSGLLVRPFPDQSVTPLTIGMTVYDRGERRVAQAFADWIIVQMAEEIHDEP